VTGDILGVNVWRSKVIECDESEELEGDGADVCGCSWVTAVLSCEVLAGLTTELLHFFVCRRRRINDCSGLPYRKQETVPCLHMTVFSDRQFTVRGMLMVLCELEFS